MVEAGRGFVILNIVITLQRAKKEFMEEWKKHDLDGMISPASSVPPMPIGGIDVLYGKIEDFVTHFLNMTKTHHFRA